MRLFFIFIFISFALFAEDRFKPVNTGVSEAKVFDSIMSNPEIKAVYDNCEALDKDPGATATCFNKDLKKNDALYKIATDQILAAKKSKDKSEQINVGSLQDKKTSPEIKKLEDFLSKRLEESLYEDIKGGNANFVDAGTFFSLYDTQLSKNILTATSSYCMDTNESLGFFIPKTDQLKLVRENNIAKLKVIDLESKQNMAFKEWASCLKHIEVLCTGISKDIEGEDKGIKYTPPTTCAGPPVQLSSDPVCKKEIETRISETTRRSCEVNNYIKSMRQNLIATKQIQEQMKKWQGAGGVRASAQNVTKNSRFQTTGNRDKEITEYRSVKEGKTFDDLTSVTTAELEKSDYNKAIKEVDEKKQKCLQSTVENDPECTDIFYSKDETKEAKLNLAEVALNLQIKADQIAQMKDDDTDTKLVEFLKQEGRSQDEIDKIMQGGPDKISIMKERITQQAENEKKAIIDSYAAIIKDKQRPVTGSNGGASIKPSAMKQLLHYNNIVSGYLQITSTDKDNKESNSGNTYILYKELKGAGGRDTASSDGTKPSDEFDAAVTRQKIEESGLKEEKPNAGNAKLDVKQLNDQILNH